MKTIILTVFNGGGEFTGGVVTDPKLKENLSNAIEEGDVSSSMEFDDGTSFSIFEYDDILHAYGPHVPNSRIILEEDGDEYLDESIEDTDVCHFTCSNPDFYYMDKSSFVDGDLIVYNQQIEKKINYPVTFEVDSREDVKLSNVYIGSMNMDETISGDEIIETFLYIPEDKAEEYIKEYMGDEYDDEELRDNISEIFSENKELAEKITKEHEMYPGDIEGKGETENDYIKIERIDVEMIRQVNASKLFEEGAY